MKLRATVKKDDNGRLTQLEVRKGRQKKGVRLDFEYGQDGFVRDIFFEGRKAEMPNIPEIIALVNETFIQRIGTVKLINTIETIENIESVDLIDLITTISTVSAITNIVNVQSVDLIDLITKISEVTNIKNIESVDLIDLITTISEITEIGTIKDISWASASPSSINKGDTGNTDWITPAAGKKIRIKYACIQGKPSADLSAYFRFKTSGKTFHFLTFYNGVYNIKSVNYLGVNIEGAVNEILQVSLTADPTTNIRFEVIHEEV